MEILWPRAGVTWESQVCRHSWHDLPQNKWRTLEAWAAQFAEKNNRSPVLWLDKAQRLESASKMFCSVSLSRVATGPRTLVHQACIDQTAIADSLACLPVFLAGCKNLLVLAGPTYTERLWCVMEVLAHVLRSQGPPSAPSHP